MNSASVAHKAAEKQIANVYDLNEKPSREHTVVNLQNVADNPTSLNSRMFGTRSSVKPKTCLDHQMSSAKSFCLYDQHNDFIATYYEAEEPENSPTTGPPLEQARDIHREGTSTEIEDAEMEDDEDGECLCDTGFIGPILPIFGAVSLLQLGWSGMMQSRMVIWWRLVLSLFSFAYLIVTAIHAHQLGAYFLPYHAVVTTLGCSNLLLMALKYRSKREECEAVRALKRTYAVGAILYQAAVSLSLYAACVSVAALTIKKAVPIVRVAPRLDAGVIMSILMAIFLILDVLVTPMPFRLPYVVPIVMYTVSFTAFGARNDVERHTGAEAVLCALAIALIVGLMVVLFGRAIYVCLHRGLVLFVLKTRPRNPVEWYSVVEDAQGIEAGASMPERVSTTPPASSAPVNACGADIV